MSQADGSIRKAGGRRPIRGCGEYKREPGAGRTAAADISKILRARVMVNV